MIAMLEEYIERHIEPQPDFLRRLERETNLRRVNGRMCSGHLQGELLTMLTRMISPVNALELGTFTGYSAVCIAMGLPEGGILTTIEVEEELEAPILKALDEAGVAGKTRLVTGDALTVCASFPAESFDLIFIDADKREYPAYYIEAMRLLRPGGYILADNTLWDGHVADPERHDQQTRGIREFNRLAADDPEAEVVIIPMRDGLSIIRKRDFGENGAG